ncbi:transcription repressor OFP15-like [Nicotiana tabacum]|uniref:Transcription repressor n=1 Tax=Nicotiana tabacum TaxID=4097 RepID=A0A1S3ZT54_TOBAC|nr:PREDICTED: transcription repressor OFP15-like [Nicotiana tabacum]
MKLPSLFKITENSSLSPLPWPLPPCKNPKTLSFRAENHNIFSEYYGYSEFSNDVDNIETVIEGLKTEKKRLFFEPGKTSSILEEAKNSNGFEFLPFKESCVVMTMDSMDPFLDFKKSMEEMVEANHEIKDCEKCLEELLTAYLKVNEKSNHRYIINAFFDLLISLSISKNCVASSLISTSHSFTSPLSFCSSSFSTSPCLSLLEAEDEIIVKNVDSVISSSDV